MTRQYNNTPTILCIYVLLVSSVGVSRHRLDTHWTPYTNSTDYPSLVAQTSFKKSGFLKFASVIGNSGIRITERNFIKKYKKIPSFFVLVLVCSQWQIYTKGGNVQNVQNAWAKLPLLRHKNKGN